MLARPARNAASSSLKPLADGDVRFAGDPIALVVAESRYLAEDGAEVVDVDLDAQPPVLDIETGLRSAIVVHPEMGTNLAAHIDAPAEDEKIFADAAYVVTETVVPLPVHDRHVPDQAKDRRVAAGAGQRDEIAKLRPGRSRTVGDRGVLIHGLDRNSSR